MRSYGKPQLASDETSDLDVGGRLVGGGLDASVQPTDARSGHQPTGRVIEAIGPAADQQAWNDTLRDLLAPTFTGHPASRLPTPGRSIDGIGDPLAATVERLR